MDDTQFHSLALSFGQVAESYRQLGTNVRMVRRVAPIDPDTRTWVINDSDGAVQILDMRTWHNPQSAGSPLLGVGSR